MIELIVIDVDGTLTDGKVYYSNSGEELKAFNIKDGLMIKSWNILGKKSAIITGRVSDIVEKRARELDITYVYQGVKNKKEILENILQKEGLNHLQVAVVGDDMNDLSMMMLVEESFAVNDANPYVLSKVKHILTKRGGYGAVAEMIEILMKKNGIYNQFIELWEK